MSTVNRMSRIMFSFLFATISFCNRNYSLMKLYMIHYGSFFYFFLFNFVNIFVIIGQKIHWKLYGLEKDLGLYETSAQVKTVIATCKPCPMDKVRSQYNFITWHRSLEHPSIVMADDVVLAEVNKSKAVFVQLPHSICHYSVTKSPFLFITLVHEAKRIIELPLDTFHRLATEIQLNVQTGNEVTFMFNSGRCGSTLVTKIVELADQEREILILSEPPILMDMYILKSLLPSAPYRKLLQDTLKFLLKPCSTKRKTFIKTTYFIIKIASDIHELLPKATLFYCYRDPLRTVIAHERAFGMSVLYQVLRLVMMMKKWDIFSCFVGFHRNPPIGTSANLYMKSTMFETCCVVWADNYVAYLNLAKVFTFPNLFYDDIYENPRQFCNNVLTLSGIDLCRLPQALNALTNDSQKGTFLGQKMLKYVKHTVLSSNLKQRVNEFSQSLNLPLFQWEKAEIRIGNFNVQ